MDMQKLINTMNQQQSDTRAGYHLTYGELVSALKAAKPTARVDKRFKGIGSWRGSYIEVAIFKEDSGYLAEDFEYDFYNHSEEKYKKHEEEHTYASDKLPTNANELGNLLESLIGKGFEGWKGGHYTITEDKPLWLCDSAGVSGSTAIVGLDDDLNFVTKEVDF